MNPHSVVHGGPDLAELRELGLTPADVRDFSASVTPLGTPAPVRGAIARVDPSVYPDRECFTFRRALGRNLGLSIEHIFVGNGSTELIHLAARALLSPNTSAYIFGPTFGEYKAAAATTGATIESITAFQADAFRWNMPAAIKRLRELRPALAFLCNPNNPTGVMTGMDTLRDIARVVSPGLLLVDEAYMPLADAPMDALRLLSEGNILLLRSMTKDYGLAGVRLGYLLAQPEMVQRFKAIQPSWMVSSLAQTAGLAALDCEGHVRDSRRAIAQGKAYLTRALKDMGLRPNASAANFLLVDVGDAAVVRRHLLERRLLVRDCASFGLPQCIRISVRTVEDCGILVRALREVLSRG